VINWTTTEIVTDIANIALALSFVVALVFGIAQVRAAARDRRDRLTLDTLHNFQTREFAELIQFISWNKLPSSGEEMRALPHEEQVLFAQFGQQMEMLGILVAERLVDLDLVDKTLGSFVTTAWEKTSSMFLDLRKTTDDPFLAEYFQWLAALIAKRMQEKPRRPYFETAGTRG
jgi:hypothetical protein